MAGIVKTVIRIAVIGGLVTGAAVVVAGPHRVAAFAEQVRSKVVKTIDSTIDDPIAMRAQLRSLESQYPKKIAEVRGHLADINCQMEQITRDKAISERVVSLTRADLDNLQDLLARGEEARASGAYSVVNVSWNGQSVRLDSAYERATSLAETVSLYTSRATDYDNDLAGLSADAEQLETLLHKLESEHGEFQAQLAHLERQIDAVSRKNRMVQMMAERQKRLDELSRYDVASLDQFKGSLAKRTAELDSQLASLAKRAGRESYEDVARAQIDRETSARARYERTIKPEPAQTETTIEIRPDGEPASKDASQTASRSPHTVQ